jgi:hypothetical protein
MMSTAVAKKEPTAVQHRYTAKELAEQIRGHMYDALTHQAKYNNHRLQAGQKLLQLRERIKSGEEGNGIEWWSWCETNIERSRKDCERLIRFAKAEDPEAALEEDNAKARERMRKLRDGANVRSKVMEANAQAWKETWLRCHPGRTGEEYDALMQEQGDDGERPMWDWRRAMGEANHKAEREAWLRDHPGNPLPEHMCGMTDAEYAAYQAWAETYEAEPITITMQDAAAAVEVDAINPESVLLAYVMRASDANQYAVHCTQLVRRFREDPPKRRGKKIKENLADAVRLTAAAAEAWTQLAELMKQEYGDGISVSGGGANDQPHP